MNNFINFKELNLYGFCGGSPINTSLHYYENINLPFFHNLNVEKNIILDIINNNSKIRLYK